MISNKSDKTKVLIIEDNDDDAVLLIDMLRRGGILLESKVIDTRQALLDTLNEKWDIIFCDFSMPNFNGMEALSIVRKRNSDIPFIFVSGTIGEDMAVNAMRNGAQDYIMKDNLKRLLPAATRELIEHQVRIQRRLAEQRLSYLSHFDGLTKLPNRNHFNELLGQAISDARANSKRIAVMSLNLDRFKTINDSVGHEAGNGVLCKIAERLSLLVARRGACARRVADEFILFIENIESDTTIVNFADMLIHSIQIPFFFLDINTVFGVSVGISVFPDDGDDVERLIRNSDIAMDRAKNEGGKKYIFYSSEMSERLDERLALERSMSSGLKMGQFYLLYQPQIETLTGRLAGVEALVRWSHPDRGQVSPADFITLAEETGFILPLGNWIIEEACQQLKYWMDNCNQQIKLSINISARQFHVERLPKTLLDAIQKYQIDPKYLCIEITETGFIKDMALAIKTIKILKEMKISVALDDFGTGYSSLVYLRMFGADYLKIDQSFIREIPSNQSDTAIVSAIVAMAHKLSMETIAEGVETQAQLQFLEEQGCDYVQGFFLGRPQRPNDIETLLK